MYARTPAATTEEKNNKHKQQQNDDEIKRMNGIEHNDDK